MSVWLLPAGSEPIGRDGDVLTFAGPAGVGRVLSVDAFLERIALEDPAAADERSDR